MLKKVIVPLSLLLFTITCVMFGIYHYLSYSIIPTYEHKLHEIAHNRAQEISAYLNNQEKNAVQLSQETAIINGLAHTNSNKLSENEQKTVATLIAASKETMGFKNILVINNNGTILFATAKQNLSGITINQPMYTSSSLGKSYERASMTLTNDFSYFNFNDLLQEPALFITIPILKEKKFIGVLTYQLDQEKIYLI